MNNISQKKCTPEVLAMMVDLLPTIGSLRDLCHITGLRLDTVRREVAPFLAIMKLQGTHPKCGCGRDRFHPYGCTDSYAKSNPQKPVFGLAHFDSAKVIERRARVLAMLIAGERFVDIDKALGLPAKTSNKLLRHLTPDQIAERERAVKSRKPIPPKRRARRDEPEPFRPFRDALYARIAAAVPKGMSDALRDDVISEMYLAVAEGTLSEADIKANAYRFASAAIDQFESKWGPRSLDERIFDDGETTLKDCIADPDAEAAFARFDQFTPKQIKMAGDARL